MTDIAKPLPSAERAEQALLAALLNSPAAWDNLASTGFTPEMLHFPQNRVMMSIFTDIRKGGVDLDPVLVQQTLIDRKLLESVGGPAYTLELINFSHFTHHVGHYVDLIRDAWQKRRVLTIAAKLGAVAYEEGDAFRAAIREAAAELETLFIAREPDVVHIKDAIREAMDEIEREIEGSAAVAIRTGIEEWDKELGGLHRDLIVIGGQTSGGKSALCCQLMEATAGQNLALNALVFSLEMNRRVLARRFLCLASGVHMGAMMNARGMQQDDFLRMVSGQTRLIETSISFCDRSDMTIDEVRAIARAQHAKRPLDIIVVDYLQLVDGEFSGRKNRDVTREQEVSQVAKQLKKMSEELNACVITPTQLNDEGKIRESRAIGQHAAVVVHIKEEGLFVAKNRHGARNQVLPLTFNGPAQRFQPIAQ